MGYTRCFFVILFLVMITTISLFAQNEAVVTKTAYDAALAKKLGGDERGMKMYVFVLLKTGPKDAEIIGKDRDSAFAGHMSNMGRLAAEGKLAVAGPFEPNDKNYRGIFIFNVATIAEAEKLVATDPAIKAGILIADMTLWYGSASLMATPEIHKKIAKSKP